MKLETFKFNKDSVLVKFDTYFKQIDYVKMESLNNENDLESEQLQIKFSKSRNWIDISINKNTTFIILLIKQIDNQDCLFSYYLHNINNKNDEKNDTKQNDTEQNGTEQNDTEQNDTEQNDTDNFLFLKLKMDETELCPIKNENIFAKLKKKV